MTEKDLDKIRVVIGNEVRPLMRQELAKAIREEIEPLMDRKIQPVLDRLEALEKDFGKLPTKEKILDLHKKLVFTAKKAGVTLPS